MTGRDLEPRAPLAALEQSLLIAASPDTVWRMWTRPEGLQQWWGAAEVVPEPGGLIRVAVGSDDVPAPGVRTGPVMRGRFVEVDPPRRLVFTFGWESDDPGAAMPPESTTVEVTLTPRDDGTLLELRHTGLPPTQVPDHTHGWGHFIGVLAGAATAAPDAALSRRPPDGSSPRGTWPGDD